MHDDDLNRAVLAARRLCFPRYLLVVDGGKDIVERTSVFVLQKSDRESIDALLTPIEGVPFRKLASCEAKRRARSPSVPFGKDGHEDHHNAAVPVGERGRARSRTFFDMLFSMIGSMLAGVPRTYRDRRVVDQIVSEPRMFATCGTVKLVGYKEPITQLSLARKAWKTLLYSSHVQVCKAASENKNISLKASAKEAN